MGRTGDGLKEELNHLSTVFQANGYPHTVTAGVLNKKWRAPLHTSAEDDGQKLLVLPTSKASVRRPPHSCQGSNSTRGTEVFGVLCPLQMWLSLCWRDREAEENSPWRAHESCNEAGPNNAIAEHVWSTGHKILWDETTSIDHNGDWFRRRIKEALYIRSSNAMNSDPGLSLKPWHCCGKLNWLTLNSI